MAPGVIVGSDGKSRCFWVGTDPGYIAYHDDEWGVPVHNDIQLFEKINLEGFQSGLSWLTILRKRENFRKAFRGFDFAKVARFGARDVTRLLKDAGIVRHRGKIEVDDQQREARDRVEARVRLAREVFLEVDRREGSGEGSEVTWLDVRRTDDRLRVHAGDGNRERSRQGVLESMTLTRRYASPSPASGRALDGSLRHHAARRS